MTSRLRELAAVFLKLGVIGFGGPAAHIALMEREVVRRRAWLTHQEFLDLLAATNLIPGPNSTELAIHIGHRRAGWPGLLVAGSCFIFPATALTLMVAWAYVAFGSLPRFTDVLGGVQPVIIAVVLQALWTLGHTAIKSAALAAIGIAAAVASALGVNELLVLLVAGAIAMLVTRRPPTHAAVIATLPAPAALAAPVAGAGAALAPFALGPLFLFFLKTGAVLFGSGYVLLAFLRADLVERWHWLSESQLLDAIAAGQITPGPVFSTATFIGYVLGGVRGAGVATLGIFLPAFVFVALSGPLVPRLRRSRAAGAFLDGLTAASLALMAVVTWQLGRAAIVSPWTAALAFTAAIALLVFRVSSVVLVAAGAVAGLLLHLR
jgi:chromate transporter